MLSLHCWEREVFLLLLLLPEGLLVWLTALDQSPCMCVLAWPLVTQL